MGRIRRDILLMLLFACLLSMAFSAAVAVLLSADAMTQELQSAELEVMELSKKTIQTDGSTEALSDIIARFGNYRLELSNDAEAFSQKEKMRLQEDGYLQKGWQADVRTYFYVEGNLYVVYAIRENIFTVRDSLQGYLNVACTVFMLFIMIYAFGRRLVRPIIDITEAARRVGAGDFDTKVQTDRMYRGSVYQQMNALVDSFNQMADDLKSIAYLRNDFVRNISHEVKTPIASISGYAQLMETTPLTPQEVAEYASLIREECAHLTRLSDNMMRISRIESRNQQPSCAQFSLSEQIRRLAAAMFSRFQEADVELSMRLQDVTVLSDRELLAQVWINLMENALKFTHGGGKVTISVEATEEIAYVTVSDTGIGISEEAMKHIFDKFYQADASHRTEGNGLGLALCKRIAELLGGRIDVKSEENTGSSFIVSLPVDYARSSAHMQKGRRRERTENTLNAQEA